MNEIAGIVALLSDEALEKRIAAAIVLGELRAKGSEVTAALLRAAKSETGSMQRHALEALAKIGARRVVADLFPLLAAPSEETRRAAAHAIAAVGEEVVPLIRDRIASAEGEERRMLDHILAELGGKDAFGALLAGLASSDAARVQAATLAVRQQVRGADSKQKRTYVAAVERFLKKEGSSPATIGAALKILGYLEDEKTIPLLVAYASEDHPASVRQEAIIALRFALGKGASSAEVNKVLISAAAAPERILAQTALHTLGAVELSSSDAKRIEVLLNHPEIDRATVVIEQLGRQKGGDASRLLANALSSSEKRRAELAAVQLAKREDAGPLLARALLECQEADRAWMIRKVLLPFAPKLTPALKKQLLSAAMERLGGHTPGWEALLEVARHADPVATQGALREVVAKIRKQKNPERLLPLLKLLAHGDHAEPQDVFLLAVLELSRSNKDVRPTARAGDHALKLFSDLSQRDFDLSAALRKDKSIELEDLYYLGFHFVEQGDPIGADLLDAVIERGGRTKVAKMAKNKRSQAEA